MPLSFRNALSFGIFLCGGRLLNLWLTKQERLQIRDMQSPSLNNLNNMMQRSLKVMIAVHLLVSIVQQIGTDEILAEQKPKTSNTLEAAKGL